MRNGLTIDRSRVGSNGCGDEGIVDGDGAAWAEGVIMLPRLYACGVATTLRKARRRR
jgi:hypothetical protein